MSVITTLLTPIIGQTAATYIQIYVFFLPVIGILAGMIAKTMKIALNKYFWFGIIILTALVEYSSVNIFDYFSYFHN